MHIHENKSQELPIYVRPSIYLKNKFVCHNAHTLMVDGFVYGHTNCNEERTFK